MLASWNNSIRIRIPSSSSWVRGLLHAVSQIGTAAAAHGLKDEGHESVLRAECVAIATRPPARLV